MMSIRVTNSQKKVAPTGNEQRCQAVDKGHADGQRDQRHHPRLAVAQLRHGHLQERQAAVEEHDHGRKRA